MDLLSSVVVQIESTLAYSNDFFVNVSEVRSVSLLSQ